MTAWRKSSYSTGTGNCVEVAAVDGGVAIRHSKHPTAGTITVPYAAWPDFLHAAATAALPSPAATHDGAAGGATITAAGTDTVVTAASTGTTLRFDHDEWSAFQAGVRAGEFDIARFDNVRLDNARLDNVR